ncbi:MAG: thiosulfate oxidation carrier complex protein SoxZ, partial [Candidatus Puniceispirillaceae bacterium]
MAKVKARVKVPKTAEKDEIVEIKTLISHPMHSGRGVDGDGNIVPRNII